MLTAQDLKRASKKDPISHSQNLPHLEIVPLNKVLLHEDADPYRVDGLLQRLGQDKILRNPPIVAKLESELYMVLDGANRITALKEMNCRDALVQIVGYFDPEIELSTWYHLVVDRTETDLFQKINEIYGIEMYSTEHEEAETLLKERRIISYADFKDNGTFAFEGGDDLESQIASLNKMVSTYKGKAPIYRVRTDRIETLKEDYDNPTAVVVFPQYTKGEIASLATNDIKLPTGITRHVIPRRALRVNLSLDIFFDSKTLDEKNLWLGEYIRKKNASRQVRFYAESTFLFDE